MLNVYLKVTLKIISNEQQLMRLIKHVHIPAMHRNALMCIALFCNAPMLK